MKLNYRIIWVDDSLDWVESVLDEIKEHLEEAGFEPDIKVLESGEKLGDQYDKADLDLIIIDYKLPGDDGDLLISKIRNSGNFTEIVFYSQEGQTRSFIGPVDGVYHCHRDGAVEIIKKVIDLTLHKLKDLGVVRGLVIASAIDLEVRIEELIVLDFGEKGAMLRDRALGKTWFDCGKKSAFLQGIVKDRVFKCEQGEIKEQLESAKKILNEFDKEVVDHRNILAHSRRIEKEGQIVLEGINSRTKKIKFNAEWLNAMRANLRKHQENLDTLEQLLTETA